MLNSYFHTPDPDVDSPEEWENFREEIRTKFEKHGLEFTSADVLGQLLPFEATIYTLLGDPPFRIFDLLFSWED